MGKSTVHIAVSARSDAFLPLFFAEKQKWYDYIDDFNVTTISPRDDKPASPRDDEPSSDPNTKNGDADQWVVDQLLEQNNVILGVCDPFKVKETDNKLKVIASIVSKAAFWVYCSNNNASIELIKDLHKHGAVICPSKGMTGHKFFEISKMHINDPHWPSDIIDRPIESLYLEYNSMREEHYRALQTERNMKEPIVITPNLFDMESKLDFVPKCIYSFSDHPVWGDFFLSGVLGSSQIFQSTNANFRDTQQELVLKILRAIQRALAEIRDEGSRGGFEALMCEGKNFPRYYSAAERVINRYVKDGVYPVDLRVTPSSWSTRLYLDHCLEASDNQQLEFQFFAASRFPEEAEALVRNDMDTHVCDVLAHKAFEDEIVSSIRSENKRKKYEKIKNKNRTGILSIWASATLSMIALLGAGWVYLEYDLGVQGIINGLTLVPVAFMAATIYENDVFGDFSQDDTFWVNAFGPIALFILAVVGSSVQVLKGVGPNLAPNYHLMAMVLVLYVVFTLICVGFLRWRTFKKLEHRRRIQN